MNSLIIYLTRSMPIMTFAKVAIVLITSYLIFLPTTTGAESKTQNWSWTDNPPKVYSSTDIGEVGPTPCQGIYRSLDIRGENGPQTVCLMAGDNIKFGTYYSGNVLLSAVGFAFDKKMYQVWGACSNDNSCLYLPGSDTLVAKQYLINGNARSLVVYKNFTGRLKSARHGMTPGYDFDASNPDYIFRKSSGYAWPIGGYGASDNGRWLAIEFRQRGIGLLDIQSLEMKRVSTMSLSYGTGMDPTSEMAVSNDGKSLSIMGINSGLSIFENNPNCGDMATDYKMEVIEDIVNPCKTANVNKPEIFGDFLRAFSPRFDADGGELHFFAESYSLKFRDVSIRASGYGGQKLDYLALGDSFTSGEGETDDKYYIPGTNDKFEKCHLSIRSYPYILAELSGIKPDMMHSVACSGAKTDDIVGDETLYNGQGDRLAEKFMNLRKTDRDLAKIQAKYTFSPGRIHQEAFAQDNDSKVITIGIGGNDAGLMEKLSDCASPGTCNWANEPKEKEQTAIEIKNIFDKLVNTYKKIHEDSPKSKIYAIGYPNIIDPNGQCDSITGYLLDQTEREFVVESVKYLNQVVEAAANSAGVHFIDISESYGNQTLCGSMSSNAISSVRSGDDSNLVNDSEWFRFIGNESFHPNSIGHSLVADSIHKSINDLLSYNYCADGTTSCPNYAVNPPEPSTYWIPEKYHDYPTRQIAYFLTDNDNGSDNSQKDLEVEIYSFLPNSPISVEITSNPVSLGEFSAGQDGSFNASIKLPVNLSEGYHTIHLYATSYSGELIELYQIIDFIKSVKKSDINPPKLNSTKIVFKSESPQNIIASTNLTNKNVGLSTDYPNPEVKGDSIINSAKKESPRVGSNRFESLLGYVLMISIVVIASFSIVVLRIKRR